MKKILILLVVLFSGFFTTYNLMAYEKIENDYVLYSTYENNDNGYGVNPNDLLDGLFFNEIMNRYIDYYEIDFEQNEYNERVYNIVDYNISVDNDFFIISIFKGSITFNLPILINDYDYFINDFNIRITSEQEIGITLFINFDNGFTAYNITGGSNHFIHNPTSNFTEGLYWNIIINLDPKEPAVPALPWYHGLKSLLDFVTEPFLYVLDGIGVSDTIIKLGFGNVEWFSITLYSLTELILSILVVWLVLRFFYKLMRLLVKIITGGYIDV